MGERWRAREERGGIRYSASNERPVPGDSCLLHIINLSKYLYSSHYPACLQDKELRTIAHCQFMKQLLHIPSPQTKYLIKEIKINYGICTARCYHACPPPQLSLLLLVPSRAALRRSHPAEGAQARRHIPSQCIPSHRWGLGLGKAPPCAEGRAHKPVSWCVVYDSKHAVVFKSWGEVPLLGGDHFMFSNT